MPRATGIFWRIANTVFATDWIITGSLNDGLLVSGFDVVLRHLR